MIDVSGGDKIPRKGGYYHYSNLINCINQLYFYFALISARSSISAHSSISVDSTLSIHSSLFYNSFLLIASSTHSIDVFTRSSTFLHLYIHLYIHFYFIDHSLCCSPGITQSDLLVINKTDLAELIGADLSVMDRDAKIMRGKGDTLFTQVKNSIGVDRIIELILMAKTNMTL